MRDEKWHWYKYITELLNGIVFLIGFVLILFRNTITISIGCSLIASAVVSYLTSRYAIRRSKTKEIIDIWGLESIYPSRQNMNISCNEKLKNMKKSLDIIAFGLKSFRDSQSDLIKEKLKQGVIIRILTMDPTGSFANQRDLEEHETEGHTEDTIRKLYKWVQELNFETKTNNITIRFYNSMTLDFHFCIDNEHLFVGPYILGIGSQQTVSYEYHDGKMLRNYKNYFDSIWDNDKFVVEINP